MCGKETPSGTCFWSLRGGGGGGNGLLGYHENRRDDQQSSAGRLDVKNSTAGGVRVATKRWRHHQNPIEGMSVRGGGALKMLCPPSISL